MRKFYSDPVGNEAMVCSNSDDEIPAPDIETTPISTKGNPLSFKCNKTMVDHITQIPVEYHIHTTIISEYK